MIERPLHKITKFLNLNDMLYLGGRPKFKLFQKYLISTSFERLIRGLQHGLTFKI